MPGENLYQAIGGAAACRKLSAAFYTRVGRDPLLRPLFPGKTLTCAIEAFAAFLIQFLGGPAEDSQRRWWLSLHESHLRFQIGPEQRDAWMSNMVKALDDAQIGEPARTALRDFFERSSAYLINQGRSPGGKGPAPSVAEAPTDPPMRQEIALRWDAQRRLDEAVASIRRGDDARAVALAETCDRAVLVGLLALMIGARRRALLEYARRKLTQDSALVHERYGGRTLLHNAAGAGSMAMVELLLSLGCDPNAPTTGGHPPLYCVGNECQVPGGGDVVRALVRAGANVDASDGVKHCTALHMAARRGNVGVAEALLDCGADIEARDSLGETPLRRSVNCNKPEVASLLLSRGADKHSKGSKGLTPIQAARSAAMKRLLS
jgi:hemoglobin